MNLPSLKMLFVRYLGRVTRKVTAGYQTPGTFMVIEEEAPTQETTKNLVYLVLSLSSNPEPRPVDLR